jgi:hypothetical protein
MIRFYFSVTNPAFVGTTALRRGHDGDTACLPYFLERKKHNSFKIG